MSVIQWVYRIVGIGVLIIFIIGAICLFVPKYREYSNLQKERDEKVQQNGEKSEAIKDLKEKQERFTTEPAFVERTARKSGMVTKDEIVYRFKSSDTDGASTKQDGGL